MKNLILFLILMPLMALAQVNETWRSDTFTLPGLGVLTKAEIYRIQGLTSNAQSQINAIDARVTTLEGYDKVIEYANFGAFPGTGAVTTLYVAKDTNKLYRWDGSAYQLLGDGTGDVIGPASATDTAIVIFDSTTGKLVKNSVVTLSATGSLSSTSGNNLTLTTANSSDSIIVVRNIRHQALVSANFSNDTASGSNATLSAPTTRNVRLTAAGTLVSVDGIPAGLVGQQLMILNTTGAQVTFNNNTGGTAANRIITGTGAGIKVRDGGSIQLTYDTTASRWYITGGVGGSSGLGDTDTMSVQDFEGAVAGDFTISGGWALNTSSTLHGDVDMKVTHATATTTYSVKYAVTVPPKFRGKNNTIKITTKSSATESNVVLDAGCTTDTDLLNGEVIDIDSGTGGMEFTASFDVPDSCTALSWTVRALPETGPPVTSIDDVSIYLTKVEVMTALVQPADSVLKLSTANGFGSTNTGVRRFSTIDEQTGNCIQYTDSATLGGYYTALCDGIYSFSYSEASSANALSHYVVISKHGDIPGTLSGWLAWDGSLYNTANTNSKYANASWTGRLAVGEIIYVGSVTPANNNGTLVRFTATYQGALKTANVNKNQKIKVPTSEVIFYSSNPTLGAVDTKVLYFGAPLSLYGDAFAVTSNTNNGTYITMKKAGKLSMTAYGSFNAQAGWIYLSKNQTDLTSTSTPIPPVNLGTSYDSGSSLNKVNNVAWTGDVAVGDVFRVSTITADPNSYSAWLVNFSEGDLQVSVSNTLPQFSDSNVLVKAQGNGGTAITASTTNIPFAETTDTNGLFNGSVFTPTKTDIYHISGSFRCSVAQAGLSASLYDNGSSIKKLNYNAESKTIAPFFYIGELTAGHSYSIRSGQSCTLVNANDDHYLDISLIGKPNVTGVDVTPFVTVPVAEYQTLKAESGSATGNNTLVTGFTNTENTGATLITHNTSMVTAVKPVLLNLAWTWTASAAGQHVTIYKNGSSYYQVGHAYTGTALGSGAANVRLAAGEYLEFYTANTSGGATLSSINFLITATSTPDTIVTPVESFSSDTATLTHKTTAVTSSDPVGTFSTYSYTINTNTATVCGTAPTQTTTDMQANGFLVYTRAYNAASTCNQPASFKIQVGKGFKGRQLGVYKSSGKTTSGNVHGQQYSSAVNYGLGINAYDEKTGILTIDAGFQSSATTSTNFLFDDNSVQTSGYIVANLSKTPTLSGISYASPRVAYLSHEVASGTAGGGLTASTWVTRTLNTEDDQSDFVTLSSNQFTLPSGEYYIDGQCPAYKVAHNKIRLRNITSGTDVGYGSSTYSSTTVQTNSHIAKRFSITASTVFEIQHWAGLTLAGNGGGVDNAASVTNVFCQMKITKIK